MFAARRRRDEKVLTVSCRPDLKSKQLAAISCGELFLFTWQGFTAFCDLCVISSNGLMVMASEGRPWL
jgi:hypothetical protein